MHERKTLQVLATTARSVKNKFGTLLVTTLDVGIRFHKLL